MDTGHQKHKARMDGTCVWWADEENHREPEPKMDGQRDCDGTHAVSRNRLEHIVLQEMNGKVQFQRLKV